MSTIAIHVIWTTFLTWPPGDERGHWSPLFNLYGELKAKGHRLNMADGETRDRAVALAKDPPKVLSPDEIALLADEFGQWINGPNGVTNPTPGVSYPRCYAAAIEPTHVHLQLGPCAEPIGSVVGRIKGSCASTLLKLPANAGRTHIWTANFWRVFLFDDEAAVIVRRYIEEHNVRRGLRAAPFPRITRS